MNNNGLVYDIHDRPKFGKTLVFAIQQVLAIMAATIAVPTVTTAKRSASTAVIVVRAIPAPTVRGISVAFRVVVPVVTKKGRTPFLGEF